ncbi:MAG: hypothetical protein B7Y99_10800 [Caulobacterales bacterium 32-69-10]|nr:MAG: hypothetical protein B7Y99_10800 [Caulobacterales bacterium 32-69-10]
MHVERWRNFKRMQASACLFATLIYIAAVLYAWRVLPGAPSLKLAVTLAFPALYFAAAFIVPLRVRPVRRVLKRYVWMSFAAGFGQTPISVLSGLGLLGAAAAFIYFQVAGVADGGRYPAGVFSGYGAGIGILFAQALLVLHLEQEPKIREIIEE